MKAKVKMKSGSGMKKGMKGAKATGLKKRPSGKPAVTKGSASSLKAGRKALKGLKF